MAKYSATTSLSDGGNRPVQTAQICAPEVRKLDGEYLICDQGLGPFKSPGAGLLDAFLTLANGEAESIFAFAQKWGALYLEHKPIRGYKFLEPVSVWRALAAQFRSLHRIAAEVNCERTGVKEDWMALGEGPPADLKEARLRIMSNVRQLVQKARLQPRLHWDTRRKQWQIDFDVASISNLLAMLVLQLMFSIADKEGFALCCGCHKSYIPERQPSTTRRNYCPKCREESVPFRDAKREQRRKSRRQSPRGPRRRG
jgi:hypothetical protein